ncbi:TetR/AcrR family transcriptional regulator [Amycolatopsis magusensis]|uniref:AcrR family transcriptional regulator n=1 Tax=Amycolatopsis magusensis TaxID=882444 RepID=A0ABS4PHG2_9PSEU|nr:TetR/AcrR family transcriptional regulator [Amycolatopsis magusensis]MBP2178861.1 AcrR family transcriptional regulator [Amycolatopsis magusensis]MDI5975316.1 TetR/AcrR family transcriptional regulator [Amycolatopsis magusensis]
MPVDGRLARGDATRQAVLRRAMDVASVDGLDGLSIGELAKDLNLSKSGVFAVFGSKEELQLATIDAANAIFTEQVVDRVPASATGVDRFSELCERWLDYSEKRIFPGGCFFFHTSAEYDARDGRVHDALVARSRNWTRLLVDTLRAADVDDAEQVVFEVEALARTANAFSVLHGSPDAYRRARIGIRARLAELR